MLALTLAQLFGGSTSQTATELIIKKADLVAVGLTPLANNHAEQLLVALLLKALENFQGLLTNENGEPISDENDNSIEYDNTQLYELLEIFHWELYIPDGYTDRVRNQIIIH